MVDQMQGLLRHNLVPLGILVGIVGLWFFVLRVRASKVESQAELHDLVGGGRPVVLEFFSNL